jgi:hypothetical protein
LIRSSSCRGSSSSNSSSGGSSIRSSGSNHCLVRTQAHAFSCQDIWSCTATCLAQSCTAVIASLTIQRMPPWHLQGSRQC